MMDGSCASIAQRRLNRKKDLDGLAIALHHLNAQPSTLSPSHHFGSLLVPRTLFAAAAVLAILPAAAAGQNAPQPSPRGTPTGAFVVEQSVTVPGTPADAFAAMTGDVLPWWDHHMFANPRRMYLEPRVGGCFCEVADSLGGNAVRHAVVTL